MIDLCHFFCRLPYGCCCLFVRTLTNQSSPSIYFTYNSVARRVIQKHTVIDLLPTNTIHRKTGLDIQGRKVHSGIFVALTQIHATNLWSTMKIGHWARDCRGGGRSDRDRDRRRYLSFKEYSTQISFTRILYIKSNLTFFICFIDRARPAAAVTAPDPALLVATVIAVEMTAVTTAAGMIAAMIVATTAVEMTAAKTTAETTVTAEMTVKTATAVERTVEMTATTATAVEAMIAERTVEVRTVERTVEEKAAVIAVRKVAPTESHRPLPVDVARPAPLVNVEDRTLRSAPSPLMLVKEQASMLFVKKKKGWIQIHIH